MGEGYVLPSWVVVGVVVSFVHCPYLHLSFLGCDVVAFDCADVARCVLLVTMTFLMILIKRRDRLNWAVKRLAMY